MSRGSKARSQVTPGVEQVLVDRVAVRSEANGEHVDRNIVERDRDEHFALALGQLADRGRQSLELLLLLEPVAGPGRSGVWYPLERKLVTVGRLSSPGVAGDLARDLEHHELVGPGGEAAEPAELVELREDFHQRVVGSLLGEIVELRPGDRPQLPAPP